MPRFGKDHPELMSAMARIYAPVLVTYLLSIVLFEAFSECGSLMASLKDWTPPEATGGLDGLIARGNDTLLYLAAVFGLSGACIFGFVFSLGVIRGQAVGQLRRTLLLLAFVTWAIGSMCVLVIAPNAHSCIVSEYLTFPRTALEMVAPGHPLLHEVLGLKAANLLMDGCVIFSNLGFWSLAAALAVVLRSRAPRSPDEHMSWIRTSQELTSQLIIVASIVFIACTVSMGFWLRLPWADLPHDAPFTNYSVALNVYYGVTVSALIAAAYTSCTMYIRNQAHSLAVSQVGRGNATKWMEDNNLVHPLMTHIKQAPVLLAPLLASLLPSASDIFFR